MRSYNIEVFQDTLAIAQKGFYTISGNKIPLKLSATEMANVIALPPKQVQAIIQTKAIQSVSFVIGQVGVSVSEKDSFDAAINLIRNYLIKTSSNSKVLVLNFANPVNPGGGVEYGANAQEEDLCRKSTLFLSLKNETAGKMYAYNSELHSYLASDYMLLSPNVEIIRDVNGKLLPDSCVVSVLTAAAPMVSHGHLHVSQDELDRLLTQRIRGILYVAAHYGYKHLILGAWGCGAFGNDAENMARLFYQELKQFQVPVEGKDWTHTAKDYFNRIEFAVLNRNEKGRYNYNCFAKYFGDFYAM